MSIEEARRRVKEAKENNLDSLNLYGVLEESQDLERLIPEIKKISNLRTLSLGHNQLADLSFLIDFTELTILDISDNQITDFSFLKKLKNLTRLNSRNNQVKDFNPLKELRNLTFLDLGNSQITDIDFLKDLTELKTLDLRNNQIINTNPLKELKKIISLYLGDNRITDISYLEELTELDTLDLRKNQIIDASFLKNLTRLTTLNLGNNQITDISFIKDLTHLVILSLNNNQITDISPLKDLRGLKELFLSDNQITDTNPLKDLKKLERLNLSSNKITNINSLKDLVNLFVLALVDNPKLEKLLPQEIITDFRNPQRIINYYLKVKDGKPINEAKIVVVGEADYGKTLLVNRLVNDTYIKTERTHGILITTWENVPVNNEKVKLNIWDFGGQKIMQNTHQYFFTERTIYILVLNARQNEASNKTREHLERIKSVAKNSPIIVVGNKVDENKGEFDINRSELRKVYNIKGFFGICSNVNIKGENNIYDKNFAEFKNSLISEIGKLEGIHKPFRKEWFDVKNHLESLKKEKEPFITYHDYLRYCFDRKVREKIDQDEIVTFLNELGIVVYLEKDKDKLQIHIDDKLIFNPEWLIGGVYSVIDNPQLLKRRAILDFDTFKDILDKCRNENYEYKTDDYKYILKMMLACKLCVKMKNTENDYLIPDHLKEDKSEILKEYERELENLEYKLNFQIHYTELFEDIFRRFLIGMYDYVHQEYYWKTGVVLNYENCKALVTADNSKNIIKIQIAGEHARNRQNLLAIIYKEFAEIHKSFPNLNYSEWIAHQDHPNILKKYSELISIEKNINEPNKRIVFCEELKRFEDINKFLDNVWFIETIKSEDALSLFEVRRMSQETLRTLDRIENKVDESIENQEKVKEETLNEVQLWLNEIMSAVGSAFELSDDNERRRFEELMGMLEKANTKEEWENNLTLVAPLLDKIGIKLESKTKIKDFNDLKEKIKGLIWKKAENKQLKE